MTQKINRVGEQAINKWGTTMFIKEYNNANNIVVSFENGGSVKSTYANFKRGSILSSYDKTIFNVGYIGKGDYKVSINGKHTIQYKHWHNLMTRIYDEKSLEKYPTYKDCSICEEWHNFQNFAKWFDENYYEIGYGDKMCLDKDILQKGNKIYSPKNCVFVPERINILFTKSNKVRGDYPIGVDFNKNKFRSRCGVYDKERMKKTSVLLGYYRTPEQAFEAYKQYKEDYIKTVSNEYKWVIPDNLYEAMNMYTVEIDD